MQNDDSFLEKFALEKTSIQTGWFYFTSKGVGGFVVVVFFLKLVPEMSDQSTLN